jgi:YD repeat-containing protein
MQKTRAYVLLFLLGVAAVSLATAAEPSKTVMGTIAKVQASERTVAVTLPDGAEVRFLWNADTRISGVLTPGARVTVRYTEGPDGKNLALQITVPRG